MRRRMDIYAGANNITTRGAVEIAKAVEQVGGIDALSVLTPMFVSQTQYEVSEYYREIASETNLPIIIYNNRPKTNVTVEPATVAKLAEIDNIIGVLQIRKYVRVYLRERKYPELRSLLDAPCFVASGAIASCAYVAPRIAVDIYEKFRAGDAAGALDAQFRFSALRIATNMGTFPVVLKEALKLIGHDCGDCVKPIQPLNDEQRARLKTVLTDMGLL